MTEVEFHTGVADPAGFACRLLRKAYRQGARVLVLAPRERLALLDRLLWTFDERDFIPHLVVSSLRGPADADADRAARTPIWLAEEHAAVAGRPGLPSIVVNLGAPAPALQGVQRLIEVLGVEADEVGAGRQRWRAYKQQGLDIRHHGG